MIAKTIQGIAKSSFVQSLKEKNRSKIIIFPNWNGVGLGFFVFFCFLISSSIFFNSFSFFSNFNSADLFIHLELLEQKDILMPNLK